MESILKTPKIIKYYVLYNLIVAGLSLIIGFYYALHNTSNTTIDFSTISDKKMVLIILVITLITAIFVFVIWLFYKLIYELLLKRLNRNYKELKKLEV